MWSRIQGTRFDDGLFDKFWTVSVARPASIFVQHESKPHVILRAPRTCARLCALQMRVEDWHLQNGDNCINRTRIPPSFEPLPGHHFPQYTANYIHIQVLPNRQTINMKASVGLVAIMAGLAMANPLAASTKTARGYITNDEFKYLRVALVSCLEANVSFPFGP
jgi:hypothetical protein